MEIGLLITFFLLLSFAVLAVIDGVYLHIFKYELHNHSESRFEHLTHSIRAVLFPAIVYFLYLTQNSEISFFIGLFLVMIDVVILGVDAYSETDSRVFMGGLPRWEYILHLFVNGFHFASIAVFLAIKLNLTESGVEITADLSQFKNFEMFRLLCVNLLPGAILIGLLHFMLIVKPTVSFCNNIIERIKKI